MSPVWVMTQRERLWDVGHGPGGDDGYPWMGRTDSMTVPSADAVPRGGRGRNAVEAEEEEQKDGWKESVYSPQCGIRRWAS